MKSVFDNYFWLPFRNDSGEEIPAYSSLKITGVVEDVARTTLTCEKPDSDATMYATNGPFAVGDGNFGSACISVHRVAKFTGSLSAGQRCKPTAGAWTLEEDSGGLFAVLGIIDTANNLALVIQDQISSQGIRLIKAPSGGIPGRVGTLLGGVTCDVWTEAATNQQIQDSGDQIKVMNWTTSAACANGDRYGIAAWCNGGWYIIAEDCNDDGVVVSPAAITSNSPSIPDAIDTTIYGSTFSVQSREMRFTGTSTGGGFE